MHSGRASESYNLVAVAKRGGKRTSPCVRRYAQPPARGPRIDPLCDRCAITLSTDNHCQVFFCVCFRSLLFLTITTLAKPRIEVLPSSVCNERKTQMTTDTCQMTDERRTMSAPGTTLPLASASEPGAYICNWSGHLLRIHEDGVIPGRTPLLDIVGDEPLFVTKIAADPFIPVTKARMLAADMDVSVSF